MSPPRHSLSARLWAVCGWRWEASAPRFGCVWCLIWVLAACQPAPYRLDTRHASANQDERIQFIILHYTDEGDELSLRLLTEPAHQVSAHYLIPRDTNQHPLPVYQLVPDSQRAWHAGKSRWQSQAGLNAASLGIEIVNLGYPPEQAQLPLQARRWQPFEEAQIRALATLLQEKVRRYGIGPTRLLGHSDVAPARKVDPGPRFPWQRLHEEFGLGAWPDERRVAERLKEPFPSDALPWQTALARYGYGVPRSGEWDEATRLVLRAFQLHFRPARPDGEPDAESWARLNALLERYAP
ncbi:N-acetylmuramoyl-L-alanine amidase [Aeromonas diversa]|uniref:N-acetylmuramoyl-L-alanine amidase n=1 Tax=Aeromonas diversa TaxID=502790 RepID=UPI0034632CCF